jgi:signal transduction histidine kinase
MALTNIFINAVQAMPQGGTLTITARPETHDGATWAEVQVRDTGRGIPAEHLPRIFEPFFTTRAAGTGLGLAVVRRIVEAHQGAVVAHSEPGQGSTFAMYLPR